MPDVATLELTGAVAGSLAPTVTLRDVELVATGVHDGSTGPTPVDRAALESMLAAAADPEIDRPPLHPGHFDPRFVQTFADGEPSLGWVMPRRIVDTATGVSKLIGDLVDVPAKFAAILPKAYARRSIEFDAKVTPSGRAYPAALKGLALLGVAIPAVKGLADVLNRYSAGPPVVPSTMVFLSDTPGPDASLHGAWWSSGHDGGRADLLVSTEGGSLMPRFDTGRYQALLAQEQARHAAMMAGLLSQSSVADEAIPPLPGLPGMPAPASYAAPTTTAPWPPAAAAPAAPAQQFAYDAAGQPVPVAAQPAPAAPAGSPFGYAPPPAAAQPAAFSPFPPAPAAPPPGWPAAPAQPVPAVPAAQVYPFGQPAPVSAPAPAAPPVAGLPGWPAGQPVPAAHPAMPPTPPPVGGAAYAVPAAPAPGYPPAAGYPAAPPPAGYPYAPPAPAPDPAAAAAAAAAGMPAVAHLSAGQLAELQLRASRGDQAMQALEAQQREHYLTAAVNEGRISVAERSAWQAAMAAPGAMAHTVGLLSALTPGRVPVAPLGQAALAAPPAGAGGVPDAAWDAWEAETFGTGAPPAAAPAGPAGYPAAGAATFAAHPLGV